MPDRELQLASVETWIEAPHERGADGRLTGAGEAFVGADLGWAEARVDHARDTRRVVRALDPEQHLVQHAFGGGWHLRAQHLRRGADGVAGESTVGVAHEGATGRV